MGGEEGKDLPLDPAKAKETAAAGAGAPSGAKDESLGAESERTANAVGAGSQDLPSDAAEACNEAARQRVDDTCVETPALAAPAGAAGQKGMVPDAMDIETEGAAAHQAPAASDSGPKPAAKPAIADSNSRTVESSGGQTAPDMSGEKRVRNAGPGAEGNAKQDSSGGLAADAGGTLKVGSDSVRMVEIAEGASPVKKARALDGASATSEEGATANGTNADSGTGPPGISAPVKAERGDISHGMPEKSSAAIPGAGAGATATPGGVAMSESTNGPAAALHKEGGEHAGEGTAANTGANNTAPRTATDPPVAGASTNSPAESSGRAEASAAPPSPRPTPTIGAGSSEPAAGAVPTQPSQKQTEYLAEEEQPDEKLHQTPQHARPLGAVSAEDAATPASTTGFTPGAARELGATAEMQVTTLKNGFKKVSDASGAALYYVSPDGQECTKKQMKHWLQHGSFTGESPAQQAPRKRKEEVMQSFPPPTDHATFLGFVVMYLKLDGKHEKAEEVLDQSAMPRIGGKAVDLCDLFQKVRPPRSPAVPFRTAPHTLAPLQLAFCAGALPVTCSHPYVPIGASKGRFRAP